MKNNYKTDYNNKEKYIYKENSYKYNSAQSYNEIRRQIQREIENKEINQIISYINSLNRSDKNQLLNICRQIANIAPNESIQNYIKFLTTSQIIYLFI